MPPLAGASAVTRSTVLDLVLVADRSYAPAARALIREALPNQLVPLGDEEDLLRSSHFTVRQVIRKTQTAQISCRTDGWYISSMRDGCAN